jgi:hypothetical protein
MNIIPQQKNVHYEYSSSEKNYHSIRKNECLHMPTVLTNETEETRLFNKKYSNETWVLHDLQAQAT